MIKDKFAAELAQAAENVANHTVRLVCGNGVSEIWRCTNNGSSCYGFDLVISRFGIAMYGDVDSLVFSVGSHYGIEFLARSSVCGYMIGKLETEYREKRELDEDALRAVLAGVGAELLDEQFIPYVDSDTCEYTELPIWVSEAASGNVKAEQLEDVIELMQKHAEEQEHMFFDLFLSACDILLTYRVPDGLQSVEAYISEEFEALNMGAEWYEYTISKHDSRLIQRLEMLRLCAIKIKKVKEAGDGTEEHS